ALRAAFAARRLAAPRPALGEVAHDQVDVADLTDRRRELETTARRSLPGQRSELTAGKLDGSAERPRPGADSDALHVLDAIVLVVLAEPDQMVAPRIGVGSREHQQQPIEEADAAFGHEGEHRRAEAEIDKPWRLVTPPPAGVYAARSLLALLLRLL